MSINSLAFGGNKVLSQLCHVSSCTVLLEIKSGSKTDLRFSTSLSNSFNVKFSIYFSHVWDEVQPPLTTVTHTIRNHHELERWVLRKLGCVNETIFFDLSAFFHRPNAVVLTVNRPIQVKVLFISEKFFFTHDDQ